MKGVVLSPREEPILVHTADRVLDALLAVREKIIMACGGKGLCATCHVYVEEGMSSLSPMTPRERMSLTMLSEVRPCSRLACQAKVIGEGVVLAMPRGRYLTGGSADLASLIGRRAEDRVLHPVDGRVLIDAGKIITRSRIQELAAVDVDIAEMKTRSLTIQRAPNGE